MKKLTITMLMILGIYNSTYASQDFLAEEENQQSSNQTYFDKDKLPIPTRLTAPLEDMLLGIYNSTYASHGFFAKKENQESSNQTYFDKNKSPIPTRLNAPLNVQQQEHQALAAGIKKIFKNDIEDAEEEFRKAFRISASPLACLYLSAIVKDKAEAERYSHFANNLFLQQVVDKVPFIAHSILLESYFTFEQE